MTRSMFNLDVRPGDTSASLWKPRSFTQLLKVKEREDPELKSGHRHDLEETLLSFREVESLSAQSHRPRLADGTPNLHDGARPPGSD